MQQQTQQETFTDIYGLHKGGLLEFTFTPSLQGNKNKLDVKCNLDGKTYQFSMHASSEKGNYVIIDREKLPAVITDLEEDMSETIFNRYL